mmetsp:Transcript_21166/g.52754  ORF Transcript_21166/g.52754 Transcript_21166/m.52754 type:complete len:286 (-) Transcript_21166:62-919(-)
MRKESGKPMRRAHSRAVRNRGRRRGGTPSRGVPSISWQTYLLVKFVTLRYDAMRVGALPRSGRLRTSSVSPRDSICRCSTAHCSRLSSASTTADASASSRTSATQRPNPSSTLPPKPSPLPLVRPSQSMGGAWRSRRSPTMKRRSRYCGSQCLAFSTRHETSYPHAAKAPSIPVSVAPALKITPLPVGRSPPSITTSPTTFSKMKARGRHARSKRTSSRYMAPRQLHAEVSVPCCSPRTEKVWQGNPPVSTSNGGSSSAGRASMSPSKRGEGRASPPPSSGQLCR